MAKKKAQPTFAIRFVRPDLTPDQVPPRAVYDALSAVQDLASGRDPFETAHVPPEKTIGLVGVKPGSAIYSCIARAPEEARANLRRIGFLLSDPIAASSNGDILVAALRPIESLSLLAKNMNCRLDVLLTNGAESVSLFAIGEDAYRQMSKNLLLRGDTTIVGRIERAGGATEMRCALRIPGRHRLLYCDVQSRDLVRRLGQHLYEDIAAIGTAEWIHRTWRIYRFTIRDFTQPRLGDPTEAIAELRGAGLSAWDQVADPEALIRELRE
jgi:hypothetical protein